MLAPLAVTCVHAHHHEALSLPCQSSAPKFTMHRHYNFKNLKSSDSPANYSSCSDPVFSKVHSPCVECSCILTWAGTNWNKMRC